MSTKRWVEVEIPDQPAVVQVQSAPCVRLPLAATITGMTEKAMRRKIEDGKWLQGREYHRDPDGNIWVDVRGVMQWVAGG